MMQLFRCGHGVCAPCFYKMSGLVLCTGDNCHIPYESATNTCQECNSDLCETCVSVHNCGANHLKKIVWIKKPFACPFCRDEGSSFLTSFGSSRRGKSANTLSQWLYEFCGNSASAISNLVKGRCNHPYLIMLRSIKKDAAEKKRIKVAKHKKAMRIASYLSRKAVMQVEHAQMVKDRKDQEDAKKPKLCESSRVRKPLSVLYTERNRNKTGKGQWVDVGMYQLGAYLTSEYILDWMSNAFKGERVGNRHRWRSVQGVYRCSGADEWISISIGTNEEWKKLCTILNATELLNNSKYTNEISRRDQYQEIDLIIEKYTKEYDKHKLTNILQEAGIPSGAIFDSSDSNLNPHYWERGFLEKVEHSRRRHLCRLEFV